jgi:ABC-type molybdate transport system substrate-binding protein
MEIEPILYEPILQGLGVVARSGHGERARQFVRFLLSKEAQNVLASHGFDPPPDDGR